MQRHARILLDHSLIEKDLQSPADCQAARGFQFSGEPKRATAGGRAYRHAQRLGVLVGSSLGAVLLSPAPQKGFWISSDVRWETEQVIASGDYSQVRPSKTQNGRSPPPTLSAS